MSCLFQALIFLLQGKEAKDGVIKAKKMKPEERKAQLKVLQNQHQNWKINPRADKSVLRGIILQGIRFSYFPFWFKRYCIKSNINITANLYMTESA